jgi:uncharacterized SAM-binding protein YcdF (DUF218 family)
MFFILAKVLWFVLQPSTLMVAAVLAGTALSATRWCRLGRRLAWAGGLALAICGVAPLGDALIQPLEARFQRPDLDRVGPSIAGIIVLGGGVAGHAAGTPELAGLNEAAERYTEAVALARRLPAARIVFSGGSGRLLTVEAPEAEEAGRLFAALGIAEDRITLESKSRNTHENAVLSAEIVKPAPGQRWLLVTSAWHMPRAIGCFRRAGFTVDAWPVDYRAPRPLDITRVYGSVPEGLRRVDIVMREYVGLVAYYLTGRIGSLLPGP